jgi:hypothetical protein
MNYRKLRIAWSVAWGILCLLLIASWVGSYYWNCMITGGVIQQYDFESLRGQIGLYVRINVTPMWRFIIYELTSDLHLTETAWAFEAKSNGDLYVVVPYWAPVITTLSLATLSWAKWPSRFSLRTLLILMTLLAVGLGAIVYAVR